MCQLFTLQPSVHAVLRLERHGAAPDGQATSRIDSAAFFVATIFAGTELAVDSQLFSTWSVGARSLETRGPAGRDDGGSKSSARLRGQRQAAQQ